jgi:hypothetical protein
MHIVRAYVSVYPHGYIYMWIFVHTFTSFAHVCVSLYHTVLVCVLCVCSECVCVCVCDVLFACVVCCVVCVCWGDG